MITTLTLNPAFDIHVSIDDFQLYHENLAENMSKDVGGKGVNISRALVENGIKNTAIILCGSENMREFTEGLKQVGLYYYKAIECDGRIRENITIHPSSGKETRLSFKGFSCNKTHLEKVEALVSHSEYVTFTGSLPTGITASDAEDFLMRLKYKGIKLVIDSKSISLDMLKRINPYLIKPNEEEIAEYTGVSDKSQLCDIALELNHNGIENVLISLGENGAILASGKKVYTAKVPPIRAVSTIGAGDSTIAGFISSCDSPEQRLRTAVSFGTAACLREGTNPPLKKDIKKISKSVIIS